MFGHILYVVQQLSTIAPQDSILCLTVEQIIVARCGWQIVLLYKTNEDWTEFPYPHYQVYTISIRDFVNTSQCSNRSMLAQLRRNTCVMWCGRILQKAAADVLSPSSPPPPHEYLVTTTPEHVHVDHYTWTCALNGDQMMVLMHESCLTYHEAA